MLDTMLVSLRAGSEAEPEAPPWTSFGYGLFVGHKEAEASWTGRFEPTV